MSLLIKNADLANFDDLSTKTVDILIENGRFKKIDEHINEQADEVIDANHMLALPGFVDAHCHMPQSFMKGPLDDMPITEWLVKLFKIENIITDEAYYYGTLLGCLESLRFGVTTIQEMGNYKRIDQQIEAIQKSGIRATYGVDTTDIPENELTPILTIDEALAIHQEVYDKCHNKGLMKMSVGPAGLPAVSDKLAVACKKWANEHNVIYQTHLAEGKYETNNVAKRFGLNGEAEALYQLGILDEHTTLAHSIWLSDHELDLIAETGAIPVHCPCTNLKISDGIPKIAQMLERGIPVCMGCDGEASSSNRDMIREARLGAYLQKGVTLDPTVMDAGTTFKMMTVNGAKALGYIDLGEIKEGYLADMILVDMNNDLGLTDLQHRVSNLLYCGDGHCTDTTIINGEIKMRNKKLIDFDEVAIVNKCNELLTVLNNEVEKL